MENKKTRHKGRFSQTFIYLGKLFRMFVFQNDWKVLPMAAIIAGLVCYVIGANLFKTMEGTAMGTFAVSCICIWNGFFNSIQVVCRERAIVKREHRSGLHISSYIMAHMIYQAFLCLCQTLITLIVFRVTNVTFPEKSLVTGWSVIDIGITVFLVTYCADMMALMISSLVHSTTTAMTIMPFLLIFQLVFSGGFFSLEGFAMKITDFTITKWGLRALCTQGDYNSLPMVAIWSSLIKMENLEILGVKPIHEIAKFIYGNEDYLNAFTLGCGSLNQKPEYAFSLESLLQCWGFLLLFIIIYASIAVISLELIDRDRR
ncbi:MAG: ABC transporter permease [Lachnospiraceae bacterium]|nr:ABC transporter permease [Lachnospiraceae bacterium]